ncbi:MAG: peptidoglycan DD-metalloendopeptidase family protein [Bacteroidales bacterium]|nr:peptidoglycan DD-metalloendopeptidase family protein [Bacteroidales bacterium]
MVLFFIQISSGHKNVAFWGLFLLLSNLLFSPVSAQENKAKLQQDKYKIEKEIKYNTKLLEETKNSKKTTLNQLIILKNQIKSREQLIETINQQIKTVNQQIELNKEILDDLNYDLNNLKKEYAEMIYYAYKNRSSFDRLMFIFSASDFNQAYLRLKYYQQYATYRKTQVQLIFETLEEINLTLEQLKKHKAEKMELVITLKTERDQLSETRNQQNSVYRNLNRKEKELASTIKDKEKAAKKLQKEIEKIIAEEIKLAAKKTGTTATGTFALTPEEQKLSANFQENKGGLPWPTQNGIISNTFGEHEHPILKQIKTKNNGIDILTDKNMKVRAIFEGEVTRIMSIPNYNYVIMVRHGEFLSVYSNLGSVSVKRGDKIKTKQPIGTVYTNQKEAKTELHFELWKGKTLLNPANWLAK